MIVQGFFFQGLKTSYFLAMHFRLLLNSQTPLNATAFLLNHFHVILSAFHYAKDSEIFG